MDLLPAAPRPRPAPAPPAGAYLVRVDGQHSSAVLFFHLPGGHQVGHAHGGPAALAVPQHGVQGGQQRTDVPLLALRPLQELRDGTLRGCSVQLRASARQAAGHHPQGSTPGPPHGARLYHES